jgi:polyketide-type polyunsaturated fatty acid synthase PfaA
MQVEKRTVPLAIVGMGCLFPKADGIHSFWTNIRDGVDCITEVPPTHWNPDELYDPDPKKPDMTYARRGGFLEAYPFPPGEFGIAPNDLEAIDTAQLLGLVVAQAALRDVRAGSTGVRSVDRNRTGVILGVTGTQELVIPLGARLGHPIWRRALAEAGVDRDTAEEVVQRIADSYVAWQENSFPGLLGNVVAGRIANRLDLGGTNCVIDAACASSLGAIHLAALELATGRADLILTGGVDTFNDIFMYMCFSKTPALSPTGDARPFAADGDGTILGEGLGIVALKRLDDAQRDGDRIYAVIRGIGTASDGKGNAIYAPAVSGQVKCLQRAYADADISPATVELVEAHGTGTKVGDAVEVRALTEVYRSAPGAPPQPWCALGSVKSQIGHTKAAAGAAGLIKAALALYHKVLPPTIKVSQPQDAVAPGTTPFYVNTLARPWLPNPAHPRRAAVSSFGFGGSNFHCVLEEASPSKPEIDWDGSVQIVALSAGSTAEFDGPLTQLAKLESWDALRAFAAQTRNSFRVDAEHRLLLVASRTGQTPAQLAQTARAVLAGQSEPTPSRATAEGVYLGSGAVAGKLAVLFPGQGSQSVGMLRDLACRFPPMLDALAEADQAGRIAGRRLWDVIYPHPAFDDTTRQAQAALLRDTRFAQPALGAVSFGAWRVLEAFGVRPDAYAGHSYGELVALAAAGVYDSATLHRLSRLRGELMAQQGGERGGMLAVQADLSTVTQALQQSGLRLTVANHNAPRQVVLSGRLADIEAAQRLFAQRKLACKALAVSAAFHSELVAGASSPFRAALTELAVSPPRVPVYANTTGREYPREPQRIRELLGQQLAKPVEFVTQIQTMVRDGVRTFVEVGPGSVLARLTESILAELAPDQEAGVALALEASAGKRSALLDLAHLLARLAARGYAVHLANWEAGRVPSTPTKSDRPTLTVPICGANYTKPRPPRPPRSPPPAAIASAAPAQPT